MYRCVMVIDDDPDARMICKLRLLHAKFCEKVISFENGKEAINYFADLEKLEKEQQLVPEIIFLDLNMPVMDGWQFLEEFGSKYHEKFPQTAIFILSSTVDPHDAERASFDPLIMGFMTKPLTTNHLERLTRSRILKEEFQIKIEPKK
jgi:CheY-like chemotaxis protein